jgi:sarcosine oxidase subunit alpha
MGEQTQRSPPEVGTTKFRPPFSPITLGALAGRRVGHLYRPLKRLAAQAWHEARGAALEEYGGWWRPAAYPKLGESIDAAALREAAATRKGVGLFDGSPLGKLEVFGPDAAHFLDLMYVGTMSTLAVGQARYGVLLNENGVITDDGIVARLGAEHFWVNTSSGGAERTTAAFEEWLQCEFVDLKALVTPVTSRWANLTVAGPQAWDMLAAAGFPTELSPTQMRHMSIRDGQFAGLPIRVLRVSFSGELGYEINFPVDRSNEIFMTVWESALQFNAVPYGIEALQIMRVEKGYIHIGIDTDGTTLPGDVGLARAVDRKATNFVGRRSLARPAALDVSRLQLVALVPVDGKTALPVGGQIAQQPPPTIAEGHVTSSVMSVELGRPVALALLSRGHIRMGEVVRVHHLGATLDARVVKAPFVDPAGDRLHG